MSALTLLSLFDNKLNGEVATKKNKPAFNSEYLGPMFESFWIL